MTLYNPNGNQYIISGGSLKSINYYISKKISKHQRLKDNYYINKYQKIREDKINDYFNRIVKWLTTEYSSEKLIIIGYNKGWKDKSNLIFNKIPFMKLINKIKIKFNVLLTKESYTSKCDGLALEDLSKHESYSRKIINVNLNGAINIMRKQLKLTKIIGYCLMSPKRI
jgi:putative transposase